MAYVIVCDCVPIIWPHLQTHRSNGREKIWKVTLERRISSVHVWVIIYIHHIHVAINYWFILCCCSEWICAVFKAIRVIGVSLKISVFPANKVMSTFCHDPSLSYHHILTIGFKKEKKCSLSSWLPSPLGIRWKSWQAVTHKLPTLSPKALGWALSRQTDGSYFSLWKLIRLEFWIPRSQSRSLKSGDTSLRGAPQMKMRVKKRNRWRMSCLLCQLDWKFKDFCYSRNRHFRKSVRRFSH